MGKDTAANAVAGRREVVARLRAASAALINERYADDWWVAFYDALASNHWQVRRLGCSLGLRIPLDLRPYQKIVEDLSETENVGYRNALVELLTSWGVSTVQPLIQAYPSCNIRTRKFLVDVLKEIGSKNSVSFLIDCLSENDVNLKVAIIEALSEVPSEQALEALWNALLNTDRFEIQAAVLEAMIRQAEAVRGRFTLALTTPLFHSSFLHKLLIRLYASVADSESIGLLLDCLPDLSERRRRDALRALDQVLHTFAHAWRLVEARGVPDLENLTVPETLLAATGDREAALALLDRVSEFDDEVVEELGRRTGIDPLWHLLEGRSCTRNQFSAFADMLAEVDRQRMVSVCRKQLRHSGTLAEEATYMLEKLDPLAAWEVLFDRLSNHQKIVHGQLQRPKSAQITDRLVERLDHWSDHLTEEEDWIYFLDLAARLEATELCEKVELALHNESPAVRGAAGSCLATIDEERFARHLPALLADNIRVVRRILRTIRLKKLTGALPWTEALWQGGDPWVRMEVLRAWRDLHAPLGTAVENALQDDFPPLVREALTSLIALEFAGYEEKAVELLGNKDPAVVVKAVSYLTLLHYPVPPEKLDSLLASSSAVIREAGLHYLDNSGTPIPAITLENRLAIETDPHVFALLGTLLARQT